MRCSPFPIREAKLPLLTDTCELIPPLHRRSDALRPIKGKCGITLAVSNHYHGKATQSGSRAQTVSRM